MSNTDRAILLWLSDARLCEARALPEVEDLLKRGAVVELEPAPITGPLAQHYQAMSGRNPASFGFFDSLSPRDYRGVEETGGRGDAPRLLPDLLRAAGWAVEYQEVRPSDLVGAVRGWTLKAAATSACLIVKCAPSAQLPDIAQALRDAREWAGESGLLAVLADTRSAAVERFVNVNNFLVDVGVMELEEGGRQISWENSLAYSVGHGQIWVNLAGRDALGVVHPQGEYEEVRDSLVRALPQRLRDKATGAAVIERIYRKEELYAGDYLFCAPDLVVVFAQGCAPSPRSARLELDEAAITAAPAGTTAVAGTHPAAQRGFLLAAAPALNAGTAAVGTAPLTSVVATLLHALDVECAQVDGQAVGAMFSPAYLEAHPITAGAQGQELSEEDEELITNRLRDLGYI